MHSGSEFELLKQRLPADVAAAFSACKPSSLRAPTVLRADVARYLEVLTTRSSTDAFLDFDTASKVAAGCSRLLDLLGSQPTPGVHEAVQAAIDYFILEEDAESDGSVIGFDDDLEVVQAAFEALGWDADGVLD